MPPCDAQYMVAYLFEIGPTQPTGAGPAPIDHIAISAWQQNTGIELSAWEARTLRRLSIDYINECHRAKENYCKPPWVDENDPGKTPIQTASSLKAAMRALAEL